MSSAAPAFVSTAAGTPVAGAPSSLAQHGYAAAPAAAASNSEARLSAKGVASLGVFALTVGASGARSQRRQPATRRRATGPTSYKDFNDPWLASADLGFDPLNLAVKGGTFDTAASAVPETTYYNYRESEVKHGRFAMTAFLAIFAEAADRNAVLKQLGSTSAEDTLDGTLGLDEVQAPVLLIGIGAQALAEYNLQRSEDDGNFLSVEYKKDRIPGDLGFDPLRLGGGDLKDRHNLEVNLGRLAMIGVTSFLVREFVIKDL